VEIHYKLSALDRGSVGISQCSLVMKLYTRCARVTASVSSIYRYVFKWSTRVSDENFRDIKKQIQSNAVITSWKEL